MDRLPSPRVMYDYSPEFAAMNRTAIVAIMSSLLVLTLGGCGGPPQIGADQDTFKAVDALNTAVGLRDPKLVDQCETKLKGLRDAGKIPETASKSLDSIIAEAKGGKWEPAQERLGRSLEGQRR
jgi:hypothetical protein